MLVPTQNKTTGSTANMLDLYFFFVLVSQFATGSSTDTKPHENHEISAVPFRNALPHQNERQLQGFTNDRKGLLARFRAIPPGVGARERYTCPEGSLSLSQCESKFCYQLDERPCRESYSCPEGSARSSVLDCSNLPDGYRFKCDCESCELDPEQSTYSNTENRCVSLGASCDGTSCSWIDVIEDGSTIVGSSTENSCDVRIGDDKCSCSICSGGSVEYDCSSVSAAAGAKADCSHTSWIEDITPETPSNLLEVSILFDKYPRETSFSLINVDNGQTVLEHAVNGFTTPMAMENWTALVPDGNYTFAISDTYGDGICCFEGNGLYNVSVNGSTRLSGGNFGSGETRLFTVGDSVTVHTVTIAVTFDNYPSETSWSFSPVSSTEALESMSREHGKKTGETLEKEIKDVPSGTYTFKIEDSYGDGICCHEGTGSYSIKVDGVQVLEGGEFQHNEVKTVTIE